MARHHDRGRLHAGHVALLAAFAVVIVAFAVVFGLRIVGDDDPVDPNDAYGVAHVHGLGINPADGSLIIATHNGSFRLAAAEDDAERIGDSLQDTMGFSVIGPNRFLGSGHPDLPGRRAGQPAQLGLIESTDAGATWTELSLGGQVDFHGLASAHGQVYGWDSGSGRFMVSRDRRTWETRSTVDLLGFAVDPDDAGHVVAAGQKGLLESTDGGRTWTQADGPTLVAISWDATAGLWGVDGDGGVHRFSSSEWTNVGALPGEAQALLATPDALYAAAFDDTGRTGIYRSTDSGATWDLRFADPAP